MINPHPKTALYLLPDKAMATTRNTTAKAGIPHIRASAGVLRIGYVPLSDAVPLFVAESLGLFRDAGLNVRLERELGWGSIREKLVYGELEAAHAPGGLLFSILCGTHARPRPVRADLVLNLQGNAITLSSRLARKGVRDDATLRQLVRSERPRKLTFAVVSLFSSHLFLLHTWLARAGIDADNDTRITFLPPALVGEHMRAGLIDGFCVGEPWNSASVLSGEGWIAATSASLAPRHPEKVLVADEAFTRERPEEYLALCEAVRAACRYCDTAAGRAAAVELLLSRGLFSTLSREILENGLVGPFQRGNDQGTEKATFVHFFQNDANRATRERALWLLDALPESGALSIDPSRRLECLEAFHDSELPTPSPKPKKQKAHT
jgi:ABC-type nitrate/sulfonate/bicarbonate transport system substrate-binding protein